MNNATLEDLLRDGSVKQKKGLHFIVASILIWAVIFAVHLTSLNILQKNLLTFCSTALLMPLAWLFSRMMHIDFQNKANPLTKAGLLFSINQMLYLLIVMWAFSAVPEKMLMLLAMVFGAHLMPFSWLYASRSYLVMSVFIPLMSLTLGLLAPPFVLAGVMILVESVFSLCLLYECRRRG